MFVKRSRKIIENFPNQDIIRVFAGANFFGQESVGVWQFRGNGVLILTSEELYFELWMPKNRSCRIPIQSIVKVETTKWHLKKTKNRILLKVVFINENGETDSAAWLIRDLEQWINAIEKIRASK
ncbi:MAG: hypothetical protein FK730_16305 [Asgard group archaeon]|nr:hypothetical protein [Asgard group archaeon]